MDEINIKNIITEEIKNFDFLGNDEHLKLQEINDLLQNEELEKQFICDSLLNKKDKIKIVKIIDSSISGNWDERIPEDANKLTLEYSIDIEYLYDSTKKPITFNLLFQGDNISIGVDEHYDRGNNYDYPPEEDSWFNYFEWSDINVSIFNEESEEVEFIAFKNAPLKIQILFIREYTQNFIENETLEIKTQEVKDNVQNSDYC